MSTTKWRGRKRSNDTSRAAVADEERQSTDPWAIYRRIEPFVKESAALDGMLEGMARRLADNLDEKAHKDEVPTLNVGQTMLRSVLT